MSNDGKKESELKKKIKNLIMHDEIIIFLFSDSVRPYAPSFMNE